MKYFILIAFMKYFILNVQPLKMELIEGSETLGNHNRTPGKYPKEYIQSANLLKSKDFAKGAKFTPHRNNLPRDVQHSGTSAAPLSADCDIVALFFQVVSVFYWYVVKCTTSVATSPQKLG